MAQIFHRSTNTLAKTSIFGGVFILGILGLILYQLDRSPYNTRQGVIIAQPIPFSHEHHVTGLGLDCRYCHTGAEQVASAGIPPTATCYNCHSQIWKDAPMLAPVRDSFKSGKPIEWNRVHDLPDYVYFNHSIHVAKGVGCSTCHGRIDLMSLTSQANTLQMEWCISCHRNPAQFVRPKDQVFNMLWQPPADQLQKGAELVKAYNILPARNLMSCSTCHR